MRLSNAAGAGRSGSEHGTRQQSGAGGLEDKVRTARTALATGMEPEACFDFGIGFNITDLVKDVESIMAASARAAELVARQSMANPPGRGVDTVLGDRL